MRVIAYLFLFLCLSISQAKTLTIAIPEFNPPFIMSNGSGEFIGFDAEIINEICRRLSVKCVFKPLAYSQVFDAVRNGEADVAIGAITISLARDKAFLFSLPYLQSYGQYLVKSKGTFYTLKDLMGKKFGIASGSVYQTMLKNRFGSEIQIVSYDFHNQMLQALNNDDIDALLLDKATADYWEANSDNIYRLLGNKFSCGFGYGILTAKGNDTLVSEINTTLLDMQADGSYLRIYSTYFSGETM